jgi:uncharacterized phage-associated protein
MPYSAASIANAFLTRAFRDKIGISPMKMQKLAYIAQGYSLVETGEPLFDELFEAWQFGPVLPSLYHECKVYRNGSVTDYLRDVDLHTSQYSAAPLPTGDEAVDQIIDFVWHQYGKQNAVALSDWTHAKGGPWYTVTKGGTEILRNKDIPNDLINDYFRENLYEPAAEEGAA